MYVHSQYTLATPAASPASVAVPTGEGSLLIVVLKLVHTTLLPEHKFLATAVGFSCVKGSFTYAYVYCVIQNLLKSR